MSLPSHFQLALALCIVSNKPSELHVDEYITALRKHITSRTDTSPRLTRVDRHRFWRDEYEKAQAKVDELQIQRDEMQSTIQDLQTRLEEAQAATTKRASPKRKQTRQQDAGTQYKRRATERPTDHPLSNIIPREEEDGGPQDLDISRSTDLGRTCYRLQAHLNSTEQDPSAILCEARRMIDALETVVNNFFTPSRSGMKPQSKAQLSNIFSRCLAVVHKALKALDSQSDYKSRLVHCLVSLYQRCQSFMESLASRSCAADTEDTKFEAEALTQVLISFFKPSSQSRKIDSAVVEGCIYSLIYRLGHLLYTLTFSQQRQSTLSEEIQALSPAPSDSRARKEAATEALWLSSVLREAVKTVRLSTGDSAIEENTSSAGHRDPCSRAERTLLDRNTLHRLQRTLIYATFGPDEHNVAEDCLSMPEKPADVTFAAAEEMAATPDNAIEELWSILGWDILADDQDWSSKPVSS